ncbi:uncharacterized protein [Littorina saxatilis]|uniref:EGF-like domain-containing protein n=1 Tax=Littorina saxatilis TaxID=31220 RepID=A0AAN9B6G1_9CAEN
MDRRRFKLVLVSVLALFVSVSVTAPTEVAPSCQLCTLILGVCGNGICENKGTADNCRYECVCAQGMTGVGCQGEARLPNAAVIKDPVMIKVNPIDALNFNLFGGPLFDPTIPAMTDPTTPTPTTTTTTPKPTTTTRKTTTTTTARPTTRAPAAPPAAIAPGLGSPEIVGGSSPPVGKPSPSGVAGKSSSTSPATALSAAVARSDPSSSGSSGSGNAAPQSQTSTKMPTPSKAKASIVQVPSLSEALALSAVTAAPRGAAPGTGTDSTVSSPDLVSKLAQLNSDDQTSAPLPSSASSTSSSNTKSHNSGGTSSSSAPSQPASSGLSSSSSQTSPSTSQQGPSTAI